MKENIEQELIEDFGIQSNATFVHTFRPHSELGKLPLKTPNKAQISKPTLRTIFVQKLSGAQVSLLRQSGAA